MNEQFNYVKLKLHFRCFFIKLDKRSNACFLFIKCTHIKLVRNTDDWLQDIGAKLYSQLLPANHHPPPPPLGDDNFDNFGAFYLFECPK